MVAALVTSAGDKLSCSTQMFMEQYRTATQAQRGRMAVVSRERGEDRVDAFIHVTHHDYTALERLGVEVQCSFRHFVTASVPIAALSDIAALDQVTWINVAEEVEPESDHGMPTSHVDWVHAGEDNMGNQVPQPYHGKGVMVGVIDSHFEFNHPANCNDGGNGATRIKFIGVGNTTYSTETAIKNYLNSTSTDDSSTNSTHGQHVLGIATGTHINGYGGTADEADIALGCVQTTSNIVNLAKKIAAYAQSQGQRCVISLSQGTTSGCGPHDGTSEIPTAFDELADDYGVVFTMSCGNYGPYNKAISKTFTATSTSVSTLLTSTDTSAPTKIGSATNVEVWSNDKTSFTVSYFIYDKTESKTVATFTSSSYNNATYGTASISTYSESYKSTRTHKLVKITFTPRDDRYALGITVVGSNGQHVDIYNSQNDTSYEFSDNNDPTLTAGDGSQSMNDNVTGYRTISVGNYVSRNTWQSYAGKTVTYSSSTVGDIAKYSSWGTDRKPIQASHPFISAPGQYIISSYTTPYANALTSATDYKKVYSMTKGNKTYWWGSNQGTSMAAPHVAGIIACWLEADPTLTVDQIKEIITETAIHDDYTEAKPERFGGGKINAWDGLMRVIGTPVPVITASESEIDLGRVKVGVDGMATATFAVNGANLEGDITLTLDNADGIFALSATTVTAEEVASGATITVTFKPAANQAYEACVTLSTQGAEDVTIALSGEGYFADPTMLVADAASINAHSFVAQWGHDAPAEQVQSYTLWVNQQTPEPPAPIEPVSLVELDFSGCSAIMNGTSLAVIDKRLGEYHAALADWTSYAAYGAAGYLQVGSKDGNYPGRLTSPSQDCDLLPHEGKVSVVYTAKYNQQIESPALRVSVLDESGSAVATATADVGKDFAQSTLVLDAGNLSKWQLKIESLKYGVCFQSILIYAGDITAQQSAAAPRLVLSQTGDSTQRIIDGITDLKCAVEDLAYCGTFDYKVKATYINGAESEWSNTETVTLVDPYTRTLAQLLAQGDMENEYEVTDLTAVEVVDGDRLLICKDDNGYANPDVQPDGTVDFMRDQTTLTVPATYDQSNWIGLRLPEGSDGFTAGMMGHRLNGVRGRLTNKVNPELQLTELPTAGDENKYETLNTYIAASFHGQTQPSGVSDRVYFFVQPKPMELATIDWAEWDGTRFIAPLHDDAHPTWNTAELEGQFDYNGSYLAPEFYSIDLETGHAYRMETAVIKAKEHDYETLYVLGNINGNVFAPDAGMPMYTGDGKAYDAVVHVTNSGDGYGYFGFTCKLASQGDQAGWDEINSGGWRFGANSNGDFVFLDEHFGQTLELTTRDNKSESFKIPAGYYRLHVTGDDIASLTNMALVVTKVEGSSQAPRRAGTAANDNDYVVYPLSLVRTTWVENGVITGVDGITTASATVTAVEYYNLSGRRGVRPWQGVNLVVTRYSDGTTTTAKVVR